MQGTFPFGAPVMECANELPTKRYGSVIVGAYPSALHVRWTPPPASGLKPIAALAVDNEPTPFWDGRDAAECVADWQAKWFASEYGTISAPSTLNGPSGAWLKKNVIDSGLVEDEPFVTDCLTTYRMSTGQQSRIRDTYDAFAAAAGCPPAVLDEHPSEDGIVNEAAATHLARLRNQITTADTGLVITLGNAAARVMATLGGQTGGALELATYGSERQLKVGDGTYRWLPLAHPAAPSRWQTAHTALIRTRSQA